MRLARPLVWLLHAVGNLVTRPLGLGRVEDTDRPAITTEEIRQATMEAAADGVVTAAERKLVLNSLALGLRKARQIRVPRDKVTYRDVQWSMDENRRIIGQNLYSRMPVCDGGMDRIIGILHVKEFLTAYNAEADSSVLRLIARPAVFAPDSIGVDRLLAMFNAHTTETILLVDETGGVEGLVTLQDVVDELVGDNSDILLQRQITGELPLHELAQRIGRPTWASGEDVVSVGGLLAARLGRIPKTGDEVEVDGVRLRVLNSDGRAVREIEIVHVAPEPQEEHLQTP
jgi:putative hemolysin